MLQFTDRIIIRDDMIDVVHQFLSHAEVQVDRLPDSQCDPVEYLIYTVHSDVHSRVGHHSN